MEEWCHTFMYHLAWEELCKNVFFIFFFSDGESGRPSEHAVLPPPGHPTGLPPQLCWPHLRLDWRADGGGRQGLPHVSTHRLEAIAAIHHEKSLLCPPPPARWRRRKTTWGTWKTKRDAHPTSSSTERVREANRNEPGFYRHTHRQTHLFSIELLQNE